MSVSIKKSPARRSSRPELIFGDLWAFDPAPETADPKLKSRYDLFINGQFVGLYNYKTGCIVFNGLNIIC